MTTSTTPTTYTEDVAIDLLMGSSLGTELTVEECLVLANVIRVSGLKDGQMLIDENETDDNIHVIIEGELGVLKSAGAGEYTLLHLLKKGDMAGELGFIDGLPHAAQLKANGNTIIYSISREDLETLLYSNPDIMYKVMRAITRTVHGVLRTMNTEYVELLNYVTKQHGRY